jgi:hypothetical protein
MIFAGHITGMGELRKVFRLFRRKTRKQYSTSEIGINAPMREDVNWIKLAL